MTLNKLIKRLQYLQRRGFGRASVGVDKTSLWDGNDTFTICDVTKVEGKLINVADEDGGFIVNKDGRERLRLNVILYGFNHEADPHPTYMSGADFLKDAKPCDIDLSDKDADPDAPIGPSHEAQAWSELGNQVVGAEVSKPLT